MNYLKTYFIQYYWIKKLKINNNNNKNNICTNYCVI